MNGATSRREPSLKRLRYFVALAEFGRFQTAADEVGITQPALSAEMKRLEEFVGAPLFLRLPNTTLTDAGATLLPYAKAAVGAANNFNERAAQLQQGQRAVVTVGTVMTFVHRGLPDAIRNFSRRNPSVLVKTIETPSADQAGMLLDHRIDVACGHMEIGSPLVKCAAAAREQFWLCTASDVGAQTVSETSELPYVIFRKTASPVYYDHVVGICLESGFDPQIRHETTSWAAAVEMVAHGLGVSIVPTPVASSYQADPRLRFTAIDGGPAAPQAWVSIRRESSDTTADRLAQAVVRAAARASE